MKIRIQLYSNSYSLLGDPFSLETECVPRAGELVEAGDFLGLPIDEITTFMVFSVVYKLTKEGFIPHVKARSWYKGLRYELLQEKGWLVPTTIDFQSYDEEDPLVSDT